MKYQPPYGITSDPDAGYINGDPSRGIQGSIPPAAAFEYPQREIVGVIEKGGISPSDNDLLQLTHSVRSQRLNYALDTGTVNNLTVSYDPPITAYHAGLTLHVRVKFTNGPGQVSINAGAGRIPIRKMNNADVGDRELPAGCIVTLIHDGTSFQLSNFGGAGGDTNITQVNVPYAVDQSTTPGTIEVTFPLLPLPLTAGDIIAVQVANAAPGATQMIINGGTGTPYDLLPNGGGIMLQGDIAVGDVVQFFYDGVNLRFPPNPEITAWVQYTVGPGQQFLTVDDAMGALRRKTIGASGFVVLRLSATGPNPIMGPISVSHPSGDRLMIQGTMLGASAVPGFGDFRSTGNTAALRAQDAVYNLNMLRTRYGTEIHIPPQGAGLMNTGAGQVHFNDLLIVGDELPMTGSWWDQTGVNISPGNAANLTNVTVWGAQVAFNINGGSFCYECRSCWNSHTGFHGAAAGLWLANCGSFGDGNYGIIATFGSIWLQQCLVQMAAGNGITADSSSGAVCWWSNAYGSQTDLAATASSSLVFITEAGGGFATSSPAPNVVGNMNSIIVAPLLVPRPPGLLPPP